MWVPYQEKNVFTPQVKQEDTYLIRTNKPVIKNVAVKQNDITMKQDGTSDKWKKSFLFTEQMGDCIPEKIIDARNNSNPIADVSSAEPAHMQKQRSFQAKRNKRKGKRQSRDVLIFLTLYLLGTGIAGYIFPLLEETQAQYLSSYLAFLFLQTQNGQIGIFFLNNFSSCAFTLIVILLASLSAVGLPILIIFFLCKGMGAAFLLLALFAQYQWNGVLSYLVLFGFTDAFLVVSSCVLSTYASRQSISIFKYTVCEQQALTMRSFKEFYKRFVVSLLFLTGISVVFSLVTDLFLSYIVL